MSVVTFVLPSPGVSRPMFAGVDLPIDLTAVRLLAVDLVTGADASLVGDPVRTRTVYAAIAFLVAIGIGLLVLAGWLIRSTRVDPDLLAPLELMGERAWRGADPVWQRRRLDEVRPAGAEPLERMAPPPNADPEFERGPSLGDFSDFDDLLRDLGVEVELVAEPSPELVGAPPEPSGVTEVSEESESSEESEVVSESCESSESSESSEVSESSEESEVVSESADVSERSEVSDSFDGSEVDSSELVDDADPDRDDGLEPRPDRDALQVHRYDP